MLAILFPATLLHASSDSNSMISSLISELILPSVVFLLATVVLVMAGVVYTYIALVRQRKNSSNLKSFIILLGLSLLSQSSMAQDKVSEVSQAAASNENLSGFIHYWFMGLIILFMIIIVILAITLKNLRALYTPENANQKKGTAIPSWWHNLDKKVFTRAIPVEKEADVMLDHDYDGIKELDNALPPWWKYGFYITIVVAFVYIYIYHGGGNGKNPTEEYCVEIENAKAEKEIYDSKNKDKVDESNIPMADASGLEKGKEIFTTACFACHGKLGEGGAGPNLTDDYWIHKGSLNDIYMSIKNGYPDKGMQAWSIKYTPKEISYLASYIKTLRGSNPANGKAPQGELYTEGNSTPVDSTHKDSIPTPVKK